MLLYDVRKGGRATPDSALASFLPANLRGAEDPQPQDRVARMLREDHRREGLRRATERRHASVGQ